MPRPASRLPGRKNIYRYINIPVSIFRLEHFPQKWVRFCGQKMLQVFELEPFLSDLIDSIRSERALGAIAATSERQNVVAEARSGASSLGDDGTADRRFGRAGRLDRAVGGLHQRTGGLGEHADVGGDHKHRVAVLQGDRHGLVQADRR